MLKAWLHELLLLVSHHWVLLWSPIASVHTHWLLVLLLSWIALSSHRVSIVACHELIVLELVIHLWLHLLLTIAKLLLLLQVLDWLALRVSVEVFECAELVLLLLGLVDNWI